MQTFLPYPDFAHSAACLDNRRLGKQRVEAFQILNALIGRKSGWANHPATLMWKGFEPALVSYGLACCVEWHKRGYLDNMAERFIQSITSTSFLSPPWLGRSEFHASHRAALLAKDPIHYGQFGWIEEPKIDYWWPTKQH